MHKDDHDDITAIAFLQHTTVVLDLVFISFTCFIMYFVTSHFYITRSRATCRTSRTFD